MSLAMKIGGGLSASEEEHKRGLWPLLCSPHFSALPTSVLFLLKGRLIMLVLLDGSIWEGRSLIYMFTPRHQ
jgi:hypothetical protein